MALEATRIQTVGSAVGRMTDIYSKRARSALMARIRSKNTRPELAVRKFLHSRGFRYSLHNRTLPGCPDLVLRKYFTVIFVNGCFWHHHDGCKRAALPSSRIRFWNRKILGNVARDIARQGELKALRWNTLVIWGCETEQEDKLVLALRPLLCLRNRVSRGALI
jgi:DNA mismatch endonuclease (patch repair protein)